MMPWVAAGPPSIDWTSLIPRISLEGLIPQVELRLSDSPWGKLLVITRWVKPLWLVSGPESEYTEITVAYPVPTAATEVTAVHWVASCIGGNLQHEVLEHLTLDGKRVLDPHV